jgi:hypothetical protein
MMERAMEAVTRIAVVIALIVGCEGAKESESAK